MAGRTALAWSKRFVKRRFYICKMLAVFTPMIMIIFVRHLMCVYVLLINAFIFCILRVYCTAASLRDKVYWNIA